MELQGNRRKRSPADAPDAPVTPRAGEEWFARVAVPAGVRTLFTYRIPPEMRAACLPGSRVVVPFGRSVVTGFVTAVGTNPDLPSGRIREIQEIPDPEPIVPEELLEFTRWIADHYIAPWGEVIKASLPAGIHARSVPGFRRTPPGEAAFAAGLPAERSPEAREVLRRAGAPGGVPRSDLARRGRRTLRAARDLVRSGLLAAVAVRRGPRVREGRARFLGLAPGPAGERPSPGAGRSRIAAAVLSALESGGGELSAVDLAARLPSSGAAVRRLVRSGILIESYRPLRPSEPARTPGAGPELPRLNPAQERAVAAVAAAIRGGGFRVLLLRGITGSGKTEVYLRGIGEAAAAGRRSLYLV
ncbi:MAG: hypothetical protein HY509_04975, partial [Acidobacteria bacterium]|nr:hypothetical protein [Acidobacteriota bacterium]